MTLSFQGIGVDILYPTKNHHDHSASFMAQNAPKSLAVGAAPQTPSRTYSALSDPLDALPPCPFPCPHIAPWTEKSGFAHAFRTTFCNL